MGAQVIESGADQAFEFRRSGLQPVIGDEGEYAGLATQPGVAKCFE
jgi:hypothetical protein